MISLPVPNSQGYDGTWIQACVQNGLHAQAWLAHVRMLQRSG